MTNLTAALAGRIAALAPGSFSDKVLKEGRRSLMNHFGAALSGCRDAAVESALAVLAENRHPVMSGIVGRGERLPAADAAFINAIAGNALEFDDTHPGTVIHAAAPIAPALFAIAAEHERSGAELLQAFIVGVEATCRIGLATAPHHYADGHHITATCGIFGAAVGAGRLLGLDAGRMQAALSIAAAQSAGLVVMLGTMAKCVSVGNAARLGLRSAQFAAAGMTGPDDALGGRFGFFDAMAPKAERATVEQQLLDGFGTHWEAARNTYKPYPCGVVLHPVLDAVLDLIAERPVDIARVAEVVVSGHPLLSQRTDRPDVDNGRQASVSAQHSVAVALLRGKAGVAEYTDEAVRDPSVRALARRVRVGIDEGVAVEAAHLRITLTDGSIIERRVEHARGSLGRPMTDRELEEKLRVQGAAKAPLVDCEALIEAIWSIERLPDAAALMRLAALPG